ncbi:MAG: PatB family C-S lyase [Gammaproteobacteria bacterium]|nr:PatB family C-S lyase [Gammaproteobacteria bacterium]
MTNKINFDLLVDRTHSESDKWGKYRGTDILPMWIADTDFPVAAEITQALHARIEHGVFGYSHPSPALIELVVERIKKLYQWDIKAEWLIWIPGVVNGLNLACRSIGSSGDGVFVPSVIYPPFASAPELSDRIRRPVPMVQSKARWVLDLQWLQQNITSDSRLLLFCNPHNPGGAVYSREELTRLAELAVIRDLIICSDEIHSDLILEPGLKHIPIASLNPDIANRSITLMGTSKSFNMAGLGCSFAIIPQRKLRLEFKKARWGIVPAVNILGLIATQAAYEYGDDWNRQQVDYLRANRDYLIREINQIRGLKLDIVEATFLAWIDVSELKLDNSLAFFEKAGVGLSAGRDFGDDRFMRLNFGCPRSLVEEAVTRIRLAVSDYWAA